MALTPCTSRVELLERLLQSDDLPEMAHMAFWLGLESRYGQHIYADALFRLTRLEIPAAEAKSHWEAILAHLEHMTAIMGRTVSLRTAVCDYLTSVRPHLKDALVVESRLLRHYEEEALSDELTGLPNRRFFNYELPREIDRAKRSGAAVSLLMLDVDFFKVFNDSYGHQAGDTALQEVARVLRANVRTVDHITRYGGEEFALILPHADRQDAFMVAERHRRAMEAHPIRLENRGEVQITVSIGAATYPTQAQTPMDLVSKADLALYRAKRLGRNRVCQDSEELRAHPRIPIRLPAEVRMHDRAIQGETINLSQGGMLYETDVPMEVGRSMEGVLSYPPSGQRLPVYGRTVRRVENDSGSGLFHAGILFDLDRTDTRAVADLLQRTGALN